MKVIPSPQHIIASHEIDTLDDSDLTPEFDFLALEEGKDDEDITLNTSFPEIDFSTADRPETLYPVRKAKKILHPAEDVRKLSRTLPMN